MEASTAPGSASVPSDLEDRPERSREAMRKAGEKIFQERLMSSHERQPSSSGRSGVKQGDQDMMLFGSVIDNNKVNLLAAAFMCSKALSCLLIKETMSHLETPALLVFLHQLTLVFVLLTLHSRKFLSLPTISAVSLHAAAPVAVLVGLQLILFFAAFNHGSVLFIVALASIVSALLPRILGPTLYAPQANASLASLTHYQQAALGVAILGCTVELLAGQRQAVSTWTYLSLWLLVSTAHCLWMLVADSPVPASLPALGCLPPELQQAAISMAGNWQQQQAVLRCFLSHALSCVPVLCLALLFQEGAVLIRHDLSVPSLSTIMFSCLTFAGAESAGLLLKSQVSSKLQVALDSGTMLALLVFSVMAGPNVVGFWKVIGVLLVAGAMLVFRLGPESTHALPH